MNAIQVNKVTPAIQKFALESSVLHKDGKPWFSLDPNKVLTGKGIVKYYAPEAGYQVEVQGELIWCSEDSLESAEVTEFDLDAFIKGQRALTRSGCVARFLQTNKGNLVYQIKAEVECKDGTKTLQDYAKNGSVNVGVKGELDLVKMKGELFKSETVKKGASVVNVQPISKNNLKVIMNKEIEIKKSKVEKELEQAIAEDAAMLELKANSERYEWLAKYLTSQVQIDFVDVQLKLATTKAELDTTIDNLKKSIVFKA